MKSYMLILSSVIMSTSFLTSTIAMGAQFEKPYVNVVIEKPCINDILSVMEARLRLNWAAEMDIIPSRILNSWYYTVVEDPDTGLPTAVIDPYPYYPVFGVWSDDENRLVSTWKPEEHAMPAEVPEPNVWIATCRVG